MSKTLLDQSFVENRGFVLISPLNGNKFLEGIGVSSWLIVSLAPAPRKAKMLEAPMGAGEAGINLPRGEYRSLWVVGSSPGGSEWRRRDLAAPPGTPTLFWADLRSDGLHRTTLVLLVIYQWI